jgi:hypothetical protein
MRSFKAGHILDRRKHSLPLAHKVQRGANITLGTPDTSSASVGFGIGFRASFVLAAAFIIRATEVRILPRLFVCSGLNSSAPRSRKTIQLE